jgi:hypothetical protein
MDIDTSRSMSSEAAKYLRYAKQCAKAVSGRLIPKSRAASKEIRRIE